LHAYLHIYPSAHCYHVGDGLAYASTQPVAHRHASPDASAFRLAGQHDARHMGDGGQCRVGVGRRRRGYRWPPPSLTVMKGNCGAITHLKYD